MANHSFITNPRLQQSVRFILLLFTSIACIESQTTRRHAAPRASIAVIGAGMSGLSTVRRLMELGYEDVTIFEALDRVGGRIHSVPFADGYLQMGAQFINGDKNPIYAIADRLGLVTGEYGDLAAFEKAKLATGDCHIDRDERDLFRDFTEPLDPKYRAIAKASGFQSYNESVRDVYQADYEQFLRVKDGFIWLARLGFQKNNVDAKRKRVFDALSRPFRSYWEFEWASKWEDQSLRNLVDWDDLGAIGVSYSTSKIGYKGIIDEVRRIIPTDRIKFNHRIAKIRYGSHGVRLTLAGGGHPKPAELTKQFDFVVVTSALGHLKKFAKTLFDPPLPRKKAEAIEKIGFGQSAKIYFVYDKPFWPAGAHSLTPLSIEGCNNRTVLSPIEKELNTFLVVDWAPNVLVGWIAGHGPWIADEMEDDELKRVVTRLFRDMYLNDTISEPSRIIRNRWTKMDLFGGSYSYVSVAQARANISHSRLSLPIRVNGVPRVMFAGEATHHRVFETAIGAFLSGRREADRIDNFMKAVDSVRTITTSSQYDHNNSMCLTNTGCTKSD